MNVTIPALRDAVKMLLNECHSQVSGLDKAHYSFDDILDQVVFELIKEEYKRYAEKHTIQYYLDLYDSEYYGTSRKYTRSIQHILKRCQLTEFYLFAVLHHSFLQQAGAQRCFLQTYVSCQGGENLEKIFLLPTMKSGMNKKASFWIVNG